MSKANKAPASLPNPIAVVQAVVEENTRLAQDNERLSKQAVNLEMFLATAAGVVDQMAVFNEYKRIKELEFAINRITVMLATAGCAEGEDISEAMDRETMVLVLETIAQEVAKVRGAANA